MGRAHCSLPKLHGYDCSLPIKRQVSCFCHAIRSGATGQGQVARAVRGVPAWALPKPAWPCVRALAVRNVQTAAKGHVKSMSRLWPTNRQASLQRATVRKVHERPKTHVVHGGYASSAVQVVSGNTRSQWTSHKSSVCAGHGQRRPCLQSRRI